MTHIMLSTIKRQLQQLMHYPEEPDPLGEYLCLDEAFEELLVSFRKWLILTGTGSGQVVYNAIKNSYFTEKYADLFTNYIIKDWKVV